MIKKIIIISVLTTIFLSFIFCDTLEEVEAKGLKAKIKETRDISVITQDSPGKRWAIVIGVNDYEDSYIADLKKAVNDAKVLSDVLKYEGQFDYIFTYTTNEQWGSENYPTLNNVITRLEYLKNEIKPNDTLVFTFSGHGISDEDGKSYLMMADSVVSHPYKTSLPLYEIESWIEELQVGKNVVLLDACRNVLEKSKGVNTRTLIEEKNTQAEISAVVYSTSPGQFSYEHDKEPYGVFTTFLIDGLKGAADKDNDVMVTFNELRSYVEDGVKEWSIDKNKKQKPYTSVKGEFHGDVIMSVIPLKERSKYNPLALKNNFKLQNQIYMAMNYSSLATMITGLTATSIGMIVFGVGFGQYSTTTGYGMQAQLDQYYDIMSGGLLTGIIAGGISLLAVIPYAVSFAIKPKTKKDKTLVFNAGYLNENISLSLALKF